MSDKEKWSAEAWEVETLKRLMKSEIPVPECGTNDEVVGKACAFLSACASIVGGFNHCNKRQIRFIYVNLGLQLEDCVAAIDSLRDDERDKE